MRVWQALSLRDRRAVVVGSAIVMAAVSLSLVVRPLLRTRTALRDQLQEQQGLLTRELGLITTNNRIPEELDAAATALRSVQGRLFPDRDALGATAALVTLVSETARRQGVLLESVESGVPEVVGGNILAVRVDVHGRSDLEGLLKWLVALEGSRKLLRVEQLSITHAGAGSLSDSVDVEVLTLTASLRGYLLADNNAGGASGAASPGDR
jgi:type II secretory pathway component PulM